MKATGRLRLVVRSAEGEVVAERLSRNTVLRQGALIVAQLFAGQAGAAPIDRVAVGFGQVAADIETTGLTPPPGGGVPADALRADLQGDSVTIAGDRATAIVVSIAARFMPPVELPDVTEAGLLAGDRLYNQVVFEPVTLRPGQEVTFFWDVEFPFGH
jgi:hypothetical protein